MFNELPQPQAVRSTHSENIRPTSRLSSGDSDSLV